MRLGLLRAGALAAMVMTLASPVSLAASEGVSIDRIWAGVKVDFDAVETQDRIYIGYYDAQRRMSVAAYDKTSGHIEYRRLPSIFNGCDGHHSIRMALDEEGRLHIAGNMHASPLVYGRMKTPGALGSLEFVNRMTGEGETEVTYPQFYRTTAGTLLFQYRDGRSGDGDTYINGFDKGRWKRWVAKPLFAASREGKTYSAYPSPWVQDGKGAFHLAWVWRDTSDVRSNCCVSYARSLDLKHWETYDGTPLALPIRKGEGNIVDDVPQGGGLMNNIVIGMSENDAPVLSYLKYDAQGNTQLYNATPDADGAWRPIAVSDWTHRWELQGGGNIPMKVRFNPVTRLESGLLYQRGTHWEEGFFEWVLNPHTLHHIVMTPLLREEIREVRADVAFLRLRRLEVEEHRRLNALPVRARTGGKPRYMLTWQTIKAEQSPQICSGQKNLSTDREISASLRLWKMD